jgi:hypothetical protein
MMKKEKKYMELVKKLHPVAGDLLLCHGLNMAQVSRLAAGMHKRGAYPGVWLAALPHGTTIEQASESEMNRMGWYKGKGAVVKSTFKGGQHQLKEGQKHAKR